MRVYNCTVNVGGNGELDKPTHVAKSGVYGAEIMILRSMFGQENVTDIRQGLMDKRGHIEERKRLDEIYGVKCTVDVLGPSVGAKLPELAETFPMIGESVAPAPSDEDENDDGLEAAA